MGLNWDQKYKQSKFKIFSLLRINSDWIGISKVGWFAEKLLNFTPKFNKIIGHCMLEEMQEPCRKTKQNKKN